MVESVLFKQTLNFVSWSAFHISTNRSTSLCFFFFNVPSIPRYECTSRNLFNCKGWAPSYSEAVSIFIHMFWET